MGERDIDRSSSLSQWDRFLQTSRSDIGYKQFSWWAELMATRGWGNFAVVLGESNNVILGGARVYIQNFAPKKCYYYLPDAPVLPEDPDEAEQLFEATMQCIHEQRKTESRTVSHVRLEPRWLHLPNFVRGFRETSSCLEPRDTLRIDLGPSEDAILQQMKPKGRYNVRLALRKGVTVVEDNSPQGAADFLDLYNETITRQDIRGHSREYVDALMEKLFTLDRGSILFAEYEGIRLATALVIYCGDWATYKYGGTRLSHRSVMAPYLLHFQAMLRAKVRGHKWYDFYGVAPKDKPNDRWADFSVFKRKFGGCELSFVPSLDYIYDPDAYREYRKWK